MNFRFPYMVLFCQALLFLQKLAARLRARQARVTCCQRRVLIGSLDQLRLL